MRLTDRRDKTLDEWTEKCAAFLHLSEGVFGGPSSFEVVTKTSSSYTEDVPTHECERDSRKRRLAELLKKREHSGTATGSASPNPPRGS